MEYYKSPEKKHRTPLASPPSRIVLRPVVSKKRPTKPRISIQNSFSNPTSSISLMIKNPLSSPKCDANIDSYKELSEISTKMTNFTGKVKNIPNDDKKFQIEFKFYLEILNRISKQVHPFHKIIEEITKNLSKYINTPVVKTDEDYQEINEKLIKKLEVLSSENIEFYKKNEELKKEIGIIKKGILFSEDSHAIEKLLKELAVKSEYISKCNNEINEYKFREYQFLKKTDSVKEAKTMMNATMNATIKRSQSIKIVPKLLFAKGNIS